jgi:hypothetical protein
LIVNKHCCVKFALGSIKNLERVSMKSSITSALLASVLMIASQSVLAQAAPAPAPATAGAGGAGGAAGAGAAGGAAVGGIAASTLVIGAVVAAAVIAVASDDSTTGTTGSVAQ